MNHKTIIRAAVVALVSLWAVDSQAYDFTVGGIFYNVTGAGTCEVTYSLDSPYQGSVNIPEEVTFEGNTYRVTAIGAYAFEDCDRLTGVNIPETVTSIGMVAFSGCTGIYTFEIPNSVTTIGNSAFMMCTSLTDMTIGSGMTSIEEWAFYWCTALSNITSLNPEPPACAEYTFYYVPTSTCVLTVPAGAKHDYSYADVWRTFSHIVELDADPVADIADGRQAVETGHYTLDGRQASSAQRGLNIIRYSDGSVRKVLVR